MTRLDNCYGTNPMWGVVAVTGGVWTMHYERCEKESASAITKQGCGPDTFVGFTGPVVRFDKATDEALSAGPLGHVKYIHGHDCPHGWGSWHHLSEYLDTMRDRGIPVESWVAGKPEEEEDNG